MSRGRQKRVEKNHQRRVESKKQKARKEIKSLYKSLVQTQLFPFLDKLSQIKVISEIDILHIWVDTQPSSQEMKGGDLSFNENDDFKQKKRKNPHNTNNQKKTHPRSSISNEADDTQIIEDETMLCRSHFFTGECTGLKGSSNRRKSAGPGSCKHHHYSSAEVTLYQSLAKSSKDDIDNHRNAEVLPKASLASALSQIKLDDTAGHDPDEVDGIDMLYHIGIDLKTKEEEFSISQFVSRVLVSENVPISSIAYLVFSNTLIFDRFDGGKIFDDEAEEGFLDTLKVKYKTDVSQEEQNTDDQIQIMSLSGHLLEHILTFLPTKYSGLMLTCCTAFYNEIGTHSPGLWKFLLKRHGWSMLTEKDYLDADDAITCHRNLFIDHYSICQNVEALSEGVLVLTKYGLKDDEHQNPMNAVLKFGSKQDTGDDFIILFWDENTVLVASRLGCFFRLVSVTDINGRSVCKEILGLRISPTRNSKSTYAFSVKWYLESVAVDDRYLVCMYSFTATTTKEYVITTMMKDQLLTNAMDRNITTEGGILRFQDLKYLIFQDAMEEKNKEKYAGLIVAMMDLSTRNRLRIEVHDDIQPCSNGVFCVIFSVYNEDTSDIILSGWMTFSASVGRDFVIEYKNTPFHGAQCSTNYLRKSRVDTIDLLIGSELTDDLHLLSIDRNGKFQKNCHLHRSLKIARDILHSDFKLLNGRNIVTSRLDLTEGIIHDTDLPSTVVVHIQEKKSNIGSESAPCSLVLKNLYNRIISMSFLHNQEYLLFLCSRQESEYDCLDFIVVHIASKTEIYCSSIDGAKLFESREIVPMRVETTEQGAMAIVVKDFGICVTNAAINNTEADMDDISRKVKKMKIKKRLVALTGKGGKKQGTGIVKL